MKSTSHSTISPLTILILWLASTSAFAVVIRDDVADSEYTDLAADPKYEATGVWLTSSGTALCGATVISPEWAISAGHCGGFNFALGSDVNSLTHEETLAGTIRHPQYTTNFAQGYDLRLMRLSNKIIDVTPARIWRDFGGERDKVGTVVGYGRSGTGLTGETATTGVRRAGQNMIDVFGGQVGWSSRILGGDFDNPSNPGDSFWGSTAPLELEGMIGLNDSGSGWYIEDDGVHYLAAITSFRGEADGAANSDYGDVFGLMRTGRHLSFFDDNNSVALHWNMAAGNWGDTTAWDLDGAAPDMDRTAVIGNGVATIAAPANADYAFVDWNGRLELDATLTTNHLLLKRTGVLAVGVRSSGAITLDGNLRQTEGNLHVTLHGPGSNGQLVVNGTAELDGNLGIEYGSGYEGPENRGEVDSHMVLDATSITGAFDSIDGSPIGGSLSGFEYVGEKPNGDDGLFRMVTTTENEVTVTTYFALPGDGNGDGNVDASDFNVWNSNKFQSGTDWRTGDFNGDSITDISDFNIWNTNKFMSVTLPTPPAPAPIPEPSGLALMAMGLASILRFARSRS